MTHNKNIIFISCGQQTEQEKQLGLGMNLPAASSRVSEGKDLF
jgi:hypothetical protein